MGEQDKGTYYRNRNLQPKITDTYMCNIGYNKYEDEQEGNGR